MLRPVQVRQLLALRTAARSALDAGCADRFTATPDDPLRPAPARTRRRSGGRVCAAWSGTVGATRGRARPWPGLAGGCWHGARPRHMSRTRPCGGWVDSPLAERCAAPFYSLALSRCPSRRPLPCLHPARPRLCAVYQAARPGAARLLLGSHRPPAPRTGPLAALACTPQRVLPNHLLASYNAHDPSPVPAACSTPLNSNHPCA